MSQNTIIEAAKAYLAQRNKDIESAVKHLEALIAQIEGNTTAEAPVAAEAPAPVNETAPAAEAPVVVS